MKRTILLIISVLILGLVACNKVREVPTVETVTALPRETPTETPQPVITIAPTTQPTSTPTTQPTSTPTIQPTATANPCGEIPGELYWECFNVVTLRLWPYLTGEDPVESSTLEGGWIDNETYEIEVNQHLFGSALENSAIVNRISHNVVRIHTENNQGNFNLPQVEFGAEYGTWLIDINFEETGAYYGEDAAKFSQRYYAVLKYGDLVGIVHQESFNEEPEVYVVTVLDGHVVWLKSEGDTTELVSYLKTLGIGFIQAHEGGSMNAIEGFYGNLAYNKPFILYPHQVTVDLLDDVNYHPHFVKVDTVGGEIYPNE